MRSRTPCVGALVGLVLLGAILVGRVEGEVVEETVKSIPPSGLLANGLVDGVCSPTPGVANATTCECFPGWGGPRCETRAKDACSRRGAITKDGRCVCSFGFLGARCDERAFPRFKLSRTEVAVAEGGSRMAEYTVVLEEAPRFGPVTVQVKERTRPLGAEPTGPQVVLAGFGGRSSERLALVFDAENWHAPQRVTLAAVDDPWVEGDHSVVLNHTMHNALQQTGPGSMLTQVHISDNDEPGLVASPRGEQVAVIEGAGPSSLSVSLAAPPFPGYEVHVDFRLEDPEQRPFLELARRRLTFRGNETLELDLLAPRMALATGNVSVGLVATFASKLVPYNQHEAMAPVYVTVVDADDARLLVEYADGDRVVVDARRAEGDAFFTVALGAKPAGLVVVTWAESADQPEHGILSFRPPRLLITPENWQRPQRVRVTALEDGRVRGNASVVWTLVAAAPGDPAFVSTQAALPLEVVDNDRHGITVSRPAVDVCAEPGCATHYSVALAAQPEGEVTMHVTVRNATAGAAGDGAREAGELALMVSPPALVFTPTSWRTPQSVQVETAGPAVCPDNESAVSFVVSHWTTSDTDPAYAALRSVPEVKVTVQQAHTMSELQLREATRPTERLLQELDVRFTTGPLQYTESDAEPPSQVLIDPNVQLIPSNVKIRSMEVEVSPVDISTDQLIFNGGVLGDADGNVALNVINTGSPFKFQVDAGLYDTAEWFQKALRGLSYLNPGPIVSEVDKVVSVKVTTLSGNVVESQRLLKVTRVNDPPYVQTFALQTNENRARQGTLVATDPELRPLEYVIICQPGKGFLNLTNSSTGVVNFEPYPDVNTGEPGTEYFREDTFIWEVIDLDDKGNRKKSPQQLGVITITPQNSKPVAPNITINVWGGETYEGYFNGTYDPDALDPGGDFCEKGWCIRDFTFLSGPKDPLRTVLTLKRDGVQSSAVDGLGRLSGTEPFTYTVDSEADTAQRGLDEFQYQITDTDGKTSDPGWIFVVINVVLIYTPPVANPMSFTVEAGDTYTGTLAGTNSDGTESALGYYFSVRGFRQVFQNNTYSYGQVMLHESPLQPRFLYGPTFSYYAGNRVGEDMFEYMVEDRAYNFSLTPGVVTVTVVPRNELPVPSCDGFPQSKFADGSIQGYMQDNDFYNTDTQLAWFVANFPNENPNYSTAVDFFRNTTVTLMCDGPIQLPDGTENLCPQPRGTLVCSSNTTVRAEMARAENAAMEIAYDQGGEHLALEAVICQADKRMSVGRRGTCQQHVYDADGGTNLTRYVLLSLPTRGRLFYNYSGPFTYATRADPRALEAYENQIFDEIPGVALQMTYVPDPLTRGTPLDHFTWRSVDGRGKETNVLDVWLDVLCAPGYYKVNPLSPIITNLTVPNATMDQCFPCPAGMYNNPGAQDQMECYDCPPGTFSLGGATMCTPCPRNTYNPVWAQARCQSCPDAQYMVTLDEGATSKKECLCDIGTWTPEPGVAETCEWCDPTLVICNEYDQIIPKPIRGGDQVDAATGMVLVCRPSEACLQLTDTADVLAGKCEVGYEGKACRRCKDGFYRNVGDCDKCPAPNRQLAFMVIVFGLSTPLLLHFSRSTSNALSAIRILINYVQTCAIIRYFPLGWSNEMKVAFDFMAVFNLDWFILSPECLLGIGYPHRVWMVSMGCLITGVYMFIYYAVMRTFYWRTLSPWFYREIISAYLLFLNFNYLNLSITTLQYFACVDLNGWNVLNLDPSIHCHEGMHADLFPAAVASIILYPIGILLTAAYIVISNRKVLSAHSLIRVTDELFDLEDDVEDEYELLWRLDQIWGFMYKSLDQEFFYWELVRYTRKFIMACLTIVENPVEQVVIAIAVYVISYVATLYAHPNNRERIDILETVQHVSIIVLLAGGYIMRSRLVSSDEVKNIGHYLLIYFYISACTFVPFILNDINIMGEDEDEEAAEDYDDDDEGSSIRVTSLKSEDAVARIARSARKGLKRMSSQLTSFNDKLAGREDEHDLFGRDKRKQRVLRTARVVFNREYIKGLISFMKSSQCTVQDVKQLEAVNQALVTVHWEARQNSQGISDDLDDDKRSFQSFASGHSGTSMKLRKLEEMTDRSLKTFRGDTSMTSASSPFDAPRRRGLLRRKSSLGSSAGDSFKPHARKSRMEGSMSSFNTILINQRRKMEDEGFWMPKCFGLVQTDKILSTFKWLSFEISDDAQAVFWRWMDAAAWKMSEEMEAADELRAKEEKEAAEAAELTMLKENPEEARKREAKAAKKQAKRRSVVVKKMAEAKKNQVGPMAVEGSSGSFSKSPSRGSKRRSKIGARSETSTSPQSSPGSSLQSASLRSRSKSYFSTSAASELLSASSDTDSAPLLDRPPLGADKGKTAMPADAAEAASSSSGVAREKPWE